MAGRRRIFLIILAAVCVAAGLVVWRAFAAPHYYSTNTSLDVVAFPDPHHAWVAGDRWTNGGTLISGGTIHATTSGGVSWRKQEFAANWTDPSGIAFANARCGWVVGGAQQVGGTLPSDENMLLATTDGGATWNKQADRTKYRLSGVACVSATHAWAVGSGDPSSGGVTLVTTDGGASWRQQFTTKTESLWSIAFADARHGWAVGDGVILGTADGGVRWTQQGPVEGCDLRDVVCGNARCAWAVGSSASNRAVILATTDGGASWRTQYTGSDQDSAGYTGVSFAGALHGWVVGFGGTILSTVDGGRSWQPQRSGTKADLGDVAFADARHGLVVGFEWEGNDPMAGKLDGSVVLRTSDGGANWTSIH